MSGPLGEARPGLFLQQAQSAGYAEISYEPVDSAQHARNIARGQEVLFRYTFAETGFRLPQIGSVAAFSTLHGILQKFSPATDGGEDSGSLIHFLLQGDVDELTSDEQMAKISHAAHGVRDIAIPITRDLLNQDFWQDATQNAVITGIGLLRLMDLEARRQRDDSVDVVNATIPDFQALVGDIQEMRSDRSVQLTEEDVNVFRVYLSTIQHRFGISEEAPIYTGLEQMRSLVREVMLGVVMLADASRHMVKETEAHIFPSVRAILTRVAHEDLVILGEHMDAETALVGDENRAARQERANKTLGVLKPALVEYLLQRSYGYLSEPMSPSKDYRRGFYTAIVDMVLYPYP